MAEPKNDLNRVGLFSELGYTTIGDPYKKPNQAFNDAAHKGKQMLPGGSKDKSGTQAGYFDKSYARIMQGEGYSDPVKKRRQERMEKQKKNIGKQFVPSHAGKQPSGQGNHYGTFSGPVPYLSPVENAKKPYISPGRNFVTNPSKKGTGYGFVNVIIGDAPQYASEPYDDGKELRKKTHEKSRQMYKGASFKLNLHPKTYFDSNPYKGDKAISAKKEAQEKGEKPVVKPFKPSQPAKEIGGSKSGCFSAYPVHSVDEYVGKKIQFRDNNKQQDKKVFKPSQGPKSRPSHSVMAHNVVRQMNRHNFKEASLALVSV